MYVFHVYLCPIQIMELFIWDNKQKALRCLSVILWGQNDHFYTWHIYQCPAPPLQPPHPPPHCLQIPSEQTHHHWTINNDSIPADFYFTEFYIGSRSWRPTAQLRSLTWQLPELLLLLCFCSPLPQMWSPTPTNPKLQSEPTTGY